MVRIQSVLSLSLLILAACGTPEPGASGQDGAPGASSLVRLDAEAEGDNCPTGGTAIRAGVDKNNDGVLSDDEITSTRYVCNGEASNGADGKDGQDGARALVRLETEEPGENCEYGGTKVLSGLDDGQGDFEGEPSVHYICDGFGAGEASILEGDYAIYSGADLLALRGVTRITGSLAVYIGMAPRPAGPLDDDDLDEPNLIELSLPSLVSVGGRVTVAYSDWVKSVNLPRLETVGESLRVENNRALVALSLPMLKSVGDDLSVFGNPALESLSLDALRAVGENVSFHENDALETLSLQALETVSGGVEIWGHAALHTLSLDALKTVGAYFAVAVNDALPALVANELETADSLYVEENAVLETLSLSALRSVPKKFSVIDNPKLPYCQAWAILEALDEEPDALSLKNNDDTDTAECSPE